MWLFCLRFCVFVVRVDVLVVVFVCVVVVDVLFACFWFECFVVFLS